MNLASQVVRSQRTSLLSFSPPLMLEHLLKVSIPLLIPLPRYLWILSPKFPRYNFLPHFQERSLLGTQCEKGCFHSASCSGHTVVVVESTQSNMALGRTAVMEMSPACSILPQLLLSPLIGPCCGGLEDGGSQSLPYCCWKCLEPLLPLTCSCP